MIINFFYKDCTSDQDKEAVIRNTCTKACKYISLPNVLEVEIQDFSSANYQREHRYILAETVLDFRLKNNRLRLNNELNCKELIIPLVHELVHLNQIVENRLSVYRNGDILWEGKRYQIKDPKKSSYEYYQNLPWEVDVRGREKQLLNKILNED